MNRKKSSSSSSTNQPTYLLSFEITHDGDFSGVGGHLSGYCALYVFQGKVLWWVGGWVGGWVDG